MSDAINRIEKQVRAFCTQISADPLLVQGAGGNISWKDGDFLWVKASGTCLADAETKDIFVPVKYDCLKGELAKNNFEVAPETKTISGLRPSIETLLHALMPHRIVVHLHPVEILVHLVKVNSKQVIDALVGEAVKWIYLDYFKPGADLARALAEELKKSSDADVVFMKNHGVAIGGRDVDEISATLKSLLSILGIQRLPVALKPRSGLRQTDFFKRGYIPCTDNELNLLAFEGHLINRLYNDWALYPDHVVFLGAKALILERNFTNFQLAESVKDNSAFVIAVGDGVYEHLAVTPSQKSQMRCYFDVLTRLDPGERLCKLNEIQIDELLDWDAEKYRQNLVKPIQKT